MELTSREFWNKGYSNRHVGALPNSHSLFDFEIMKILQQYLPSRKGLNLIEMGCGGSKWLPYFYRKFRYNVFGVDYSKTGVEKARENLVMSNCKGRIWHLDFVQDLPSNLYNSFDILMSVGVIEHFDHPEKILGIFAKLLQKGGTIVTICPNMTGLAGYMQKVLSRETYNLHKIFSLASLRSWHIKTNFRIIYGSYFYLSDFGKVLPIWDRLPSSIRPLYSGINSFINNFFVLSYRLIKKINEYFPFLCSMVIVIGVKNK